MPHRLLDPIDDGGPLGVPEVLPPPPRRRRRIRGGGEGLDDHTRLQERRLVLRAEGGLRGGPALHLRGGDTAAEEEISGECKFHVENKTHIKLKNKNPI